MNASAYPGRALGPAHTVDELRAIAKQYRHANDHTTADAYDSLANFRARIERTTKEQ
ncbi:hypothetical protein PP996_gp31 [Gordonia phage SheckWes]|uniref:Uncharacterized protein n=1 Tax=Gordonia phage SheckWes TaxID=2591117 RepID=A0A515MII6_9CAUD|nr:hypothetical protein PP996_gp31 [Gordonia phage SheckWes]QDM56457.1 hypothetical protein SEA_SHECKWES_31 [Gordonia phage SheckWes]